MGRAKNASRNIYWGVLDKIISLGFPFITRTVMIYTMGVSYVGLGSLFSSILTVLNFTELGIGGALAFSMYKPMAENNERSINAYLNFYRKIYRIIGTIILIMSLLMLPFLDRFISGDIPAGMNLKALFLICSCNNVIGYFFFVYKQSVLVAAQRVDLMSKRNMFVQCAINVIQIICLLLFHNYYIYLLVLPISTVCNNLLIAYIVNKTYPQYKCSGFITKDEIKILKKQVSGIIFQKMGNIVLTSVDTLVISAFLGLQILGIYQGYYYILAGLISILTAIQSALIPSIGNSVALNSVEKNLKDFHKFNFLYQWIVTWWCSCLLCLFQPFIWIWVGNENMLSDTMVILFVLLFFSQNISAVCGMYREAIGMWWEAKFVPIISSIVNLILNLTLINIIGLPGVVISTIVSMLFINFPCGSYVLFHKYFKSKKEYISYMMGTMYNFIVICITSMITYWVCSFVTQYGMYGLLIKIIICSIVPNVLFVILNLKHKEFKDSIIFLKNLIPHKFLLKLMNRF